MQVEKSPNCVSLRLATYNIYNTTARYLGGRRSHLLRAVEGLAADIIGFQEVAFGVQQPPELDQVVDLQRLGWFVAPAQSQQCICPAEAATDPLFRIDGNAIGVRPGCDWLLVDGSHHILHFEAQSSVHGCVRVAQRGVFSCGGLQLLICNTHLHWADGVTCSEHDAVLRGKQAAELIEWAKDGAQLLPIVLLGDFNFLFQNEPARDSILVAGFRSACASLHGEDPPTCPTPLQAPTILPEACIEQRCDIVFFKHGDNGTSVVPTSAGIGQTSAESAKHDLTLYASDHYAVIATLCLTAAA